MILVGQYDSPYVRRVAISLHLLGLPFERDTRSTFADAEAMRTINPLGRIPSLVLDDGEVLIDSAAILDYLDELVGPDRALIPPRGLDRRRALRMIALASGAVDKAAAIAYERMLRPPEQQFAPWLERCRTQVDSGLVALEAALAASAAGSAIAGWYAGAPRPMQADIMIGCLVAYLRHRVQDAFPAGAYPAIEHHAAACDALPAFAQTRPADDEQMPSGV